MTTPGINDQLSAIEQKLATDNSNDVFNEKQFSELTRARIGRIFVWGFFVALIGSIVFVIAYNLLIYSMTQNIELFLDVENIIPLV